MGILDDAIKEHLELKRQHGADQSELKKLEDEAFGASERPGTEESASDQLAEAPTQFMTQPDLDAPEKESRDEAPEAPLRGRTEIADLQEPPVESVDAAEAAPEEPDEEPSPAMEHEAIAEPPAEETSPVVDEAATDESEAESTAGPSTEERHAIAEHPTEMYDVEAELGDAEPTDAEPEVHAVGEEKLSEEDEEFWDEKRLSDELDQALEAPIELQEPEVAEADAQPEADEPEAPRAEERPTEPPGNQDVLDETPDFLEEKPEDDELWFEQKPPKDFDFDD
ncbi:MAG TPA: hypothetical protein VFY04_05510 [Solirubrobacterales bacterium]|nr:hypothetical protein [Solirubrobacterales bacterium]